MKFSRAGIRPLAAAALLGALLWLPSAASPARVAAASCTSWTSSTTAPPTVRVLRSGTGIVATVDLESYTKVVMAAEFNRTWPMETLRAGAIAVKEYAWYYTMHYRGGTGTGGCYDVIDTSTDQIYSPESRFPAATQIQAVESTWGESALKGGVIFLTGYRSGNLVACGADADGYHLWQLSARQCGLLGHSAEYILHVYYDPIAIQGGPVAPNAPTGVVAQPFDTSAQVAWSAPAFNGGGTITGYAATSSPDGKTCTTAGATSCSISGLTNGQSYTFTVTATNRYGTGVASDPSAAVTPAIVPGSTYHPIAPARLLDTRAKTGLSGKFVAGAPRPFQITSDAGAVPTGATAVTGNLTVVGESNGWAVYLGPNSEAHPATSTLNFSKGDVTANGVTVALSSTGSLSATYLSTSGQTTDLVFDVTGYFTQDMTGDTYHPLTPTRIVDSRKAIGLGGHLLAGKPATFTVWKHGSVPDTATAITGNLTVTNSTGSWAVYLGPAPIVKPSTSTINFKRGQVVANNVTVALSGTGTLSATFLGTAGTTTELVFDVTGYFTADATGDTYVPTTPVRLLDSRIGNGIAGKLGAGQPGTFLVTTRACFPPTADAVTGNLTIVNQTGGWAAFVGPDPVSNAQASTINFVKGDIKGNGLAVALGSAGSLSATYVSVAGNTTDLVFDVTGYFAP